MMVKKIGLLILCFMVFITLNVKSSPNQPEDGLVGIRSITYQEMSIVHIWNNNSKLIIVNDTYSYWTDKGKDYYISADDFLSISNVKARWLNEEICIKAENKGIQKCTDDLNMDYRIYSDNETYASLNGSSSKLFGNVNVTFRFDYYLSQADKFIHKIYFLNYSKQNALNISMTWKYYNISIAGTPDNDEILINKTKYVDLSRNLNRNLIIWNEQNSLAHEIYLIDRNESKYWVNFWNFKYPYAIKVKKQPEWDNSVVTNKFLIGYDKPIQLTRYWIDADLCSCTGRYVCVITLYHHSYQPGVRNLEAYSNESFGVYDFSSDPDPCEMPTRIEYFSKSAGWTPMYNVFPQSMNALGCYLMDVSNCEIAVDKNSFEWWDVMFTNGTGNITIRANYYNPGVKSANYTVNLNDSLPRVVLDSPINNYNQTNNHNVTFTCSAFDRNGINNLSFWVDGGSLSLNKTFYNQPTFSDLIFHARFENNLTSEEGIDPLTYNAIGFRDSIKGTTGEFNESSPSKLVYNISTLDLNEGSFGAWVKIDKPLSPSVTGLNSGLICLGCSNMSLVFGAPALYGNYFVIWYSANTWTFQAGKKNVYSSKTHTYWLENDKWYRVFLTWTEEADELIVEFYINGLLVKRDMDLVTDIQPVNISIGEFTLANQFVSTTYKWNGSIDEVVVYNRKLEPIEVYKDYVNGSVTHSVKVDDFELGEHNWTCYASDMIFGRYNEWSNKSVSTSNRTFSILELIISTPPSNLWKIAVAIILFGGATIWILLIREHTKGETKNEEE